MPADRLVTVNIEAEGSRDQFGQYVPGAVTPVRMWARSRDKSLRDIIESGGRRDTGERNWQVRWRSDLAATPTSRLTVQDGSRLFSVDNMIELTGRDRATRRRFIELEGQFST